MVFGFVGFDERDEEQERARAGGTEAEREGGTGGTSGPASGGETPDGDGEAKPGEKG